MKKLAFLLICFVFSVSVSAHQQTVAFHKEIASKTYVMENSEANTMMYNGGNGGILQMIYNAFYKLGSFMAATVNDADETLNNPTNLEN